MEWNKGLIDAVLVPSAVVLLLLYHAFLFYKVRTRPSQTVMGINRTARRLWVYEMLIENHKKNVLAVQTIRNSIMESTLMATTAVLLTAALAAYFTFANSIKQPLEVNSIQNGVSCTVKSFSILVCFMISFLCHTQSIRFLNHVNYMINIPLEATGGVITADYIGDLMERGTVYYAFGSRSFYVAFPLLIWAFGSIPMFLCTVVLVHALYSVDFVDDEARNSGKVLKEAEVERQI